MGSTRGKPAHWRGPSRLAGYEAEQVAPPRDATLEQALGYAAARRSWVQAMEDGDGPAIEALRAAGMSWDRISKSLGGVPTGQTLRVLYGPVIAAKSKRRRAS